MRREIEILKLAYGGEGLGYLDGKVCFVEGALPGEKVIAEILQSKKNFSRGLAVEILSPSPARVEPPCPYVHSCGGCQYQHVSYAEELKWKETQVREHISRNLGVEPGRIAGIVASPREYRYRTSVTLHRGRERAGFVGKDNRTVVEVADCLLAREPLAKVFRTENFGRDEESVSFRLSRDAEIVSSLENKLFRAEAAGADILTHSKGFFQNNPEITAAVGHELASWAGEAAQAAFADLFAGCGTFTILAAPPGSTLLCIEGNPHSVSALRENLREKNLRAEVLEGPVEALFPRWQDRNTPAGLFLFMDPPRKGLEPAFAEFLASNGAVAEIAYLSCHLGTLTRDLKTILSGGRYRLEKAVPFDMFPKTKHIEVLVRLRVAPEGERANAGG